jgi:hypothetical protein
VCHFQEVFRRPLEWRVRMWTRVEVIYSSRGTGLLIWWTLVMNAWFRSKVRCGVTHADKRLWRLSRSRNYAECGIAGIKR